MLDALALIAATAIGLTVTRSLPEYLGTEELITINTRMETNSGGGWAVASRGGFFTSAGRPLDRRASYWLGHAPYWSGPCLASWSVAMLGLSLRGPRSRRRLRCPGMAAGLAVVVASVVHATRHLQHATVYPTPHNWPLLSDGRFWSYYWITLPRVAGYTAAVWWVALALGGPRSAEAGSFGRLGRALGWSWIAMALASESGVWCFALNY